MATVTVVAALMLSGCGGGAGGSDAVTGATVPPATTTTLDLAHLPPHPQASQADFDAIVRELYAIVDVAYATSDSSVLRLAYHAACECVLSEGKTLDERAAKGLVETGGLPEILEISVLKVESSSAVFIKVIDQGEPGVLKSGSRDEVGRTAGWTATARRLALGRPDDRWMVIEFAACDRVRKGPPC